MRQLLIIFFICFLSCNNADNNEFQLQIGDILFQDLDSSPLCDAIEMVTPGHNNYNFSHIGIVVELGDPNCINSDYIYEDNIRVLEAIPNKVTTTRLDSFLNRSTDSDKKPKVIVARLKKRYQYSITDAVIFLNSKIGMKYDDFFIKDNNKYYCSELIHEAFEKDSIFKLHPMTFIDPKTRNTMYIWQKYYQGLEIRIPEGEPGINPGIMSISEKIEIVHKYGEPSKKNNE
jgi:hypothetical protein